jgi:IS5 family transposase
VWLFREQLKVLNLVDELFARFHEQLASHGYAARSGQMVDATFVEVPRQRNKREENVLIKEGAIPIEWGKDEHKLSQKDTDARWTKKNNTNYYGYKNHINADHETKLVQSYEVTDASVHDSQVFDELLDHAEDTDGNKRAVYADSAYRSNATEEKLAKDGIASQICEKGTRAAALTEEQKEANKKKSKVRARVEHVFGAQDAMGGHWVRTIGLLRAKVKIGMMNLVYNMIRLVQLLRRDMKMTG